MKDKKPELDLKIMQALYGFGGLYYYRVSRFDEITREKVVIRGTFNEEAAKELVEDYRKRNIVAWCDQILVHFDGAYAKNGKGKK